MSLYASHIQTSWFQKSLLAVGSGLGAFFNPTRDEFIATFGETTANQALLLMRRKMVEDPEGRRILRQRPLINSQTLSSSSLRHSPAGSFGEAYIKFLETNGVSPDTRKRVHFVDDEELAYVMQRYREVHDLIHTLLGMKTNLLGEITVKWVEGLQFGLPMCVTAGVVGPVRLKPKHRQLYLRTYLPWAQEAGRTSKFLLNVYFEERWHQDLRELRRELRIPDPPKSAATNAYDMSLLYKTDDKSTISNNDFVFESQSSVKGSSHMKVF